MEDYPEELRTPPVPLVSVVGCPELHQTISAYLHSQQPPMNTLAFPDFSKVALLAGKQRETVDSGQAFGILKRDWLIKHRTRVPSVVAALFWSDHVSGDPAQWLQVSTDLENLKAVIHGRNIKLIVVLVQSTFKEDVSEDRAIALRKRAEVDSKHLVIFAQNDTSELSQSLSRLSSIFAELANTYYREEGRRIRNRVEKRSFSCVELHIRFCFKVAVYAEFRRDWVEALRFYEDAYHALLEMIATSTRLPPIQRLIEIKAVAEQLHFKVSTLLLHGGKVIEAVTWFRQHISSYKRLVGAPEVVFLHWDWVSKQFLVFAELLETSSAAIPSTASLDERHLTEWEFQPAHYYQLAANYLREKIFFLDTSLTTSQTWGESEAVYTIESPAVVPSIYVGQFARLLEQDDAFAMQPLTDAEYVLYALAEGKRFQDSYEIIALLKRSFESYNNLKAQRTASYCNNLMAREYFAAGDFSSAKQIFDGVAGLYRREGWVTFLWEVLGYLRECSRNLGLAKEFIEYSLEMASLPICSSAGIESSNKRGEYGPAGPPSLSQRENIQREVLWLSRGQSTLVSSEGSSGLTVTEDNPICLEIDLVSPLRAALLTSVAFHEQTVEPLASTSLTISLLSQLPHPLEIDQLEIQFNQSICNFTITKQELPLVGSSPGQQTTRIETVPNLEIVCNKWLRLTFDIKSGQSGKLECLSLIAKIGHHFTICSRAESPASMEDLPLWKFEDRVDSFPTKDPSLAFSGQKFIQVEEPEPQVDLLLHPSGPALVGENFVVPVTITSKGHTVHSGELKINLVDTRGGGLASPRDLEPFSSDSLHVELLGISGSAGEQEPQTGVDNIKKIQQSFGLLSVPFLDIGQSWSGKLEIKWHRAKPVMLYVSLGYLPNSRETTAQNVHVHKSLQIEGKNPVVISHRFMMPFRKDPLLLLKIKHSPESDSSPSLALNETSILIVCARNCTEVPLRLISLSIDAERDKDGHSCTVHQSNEHAVDLDLLVPGDEFRRVFLVTPEVNSPKLDVGTVCLRWIRYSEPEREALSGEKLDGVITKHKLPDVNVEKAPLLAILECPPNAILGIPFSFYMKIRNQTQLLQEIRYSLADSQSFLISGPHNDAAFILPNSEHILSYKLVPLVSGQQQLPRISLTSVRYSAGLQPSLAASTVFVFPTEPHFKMN